MGQLAYASREEELAALIADQQRDDAAQVLYPERFVSWSLDLVTSDERTFGETIAIDEDGNIFCAISTRSPGFAMGRLIPHGTAGGYSNHGCRCPDCTAAKSAEVAAWKAKNRPRLPIVVRVCALEGCEVEFETVQPKKLYCCRQHLQKDQYRKNRESERAKRRERYYRLERTAA